MICYWNSTQFTQHCQQTIEKTKCEIYVISILVPNTEQKNISFWKQENLSVLPVLVLTTIQCSYRWNMQYLEDVDKLSRGHVNNGLHHGESKHDKVNAAARYKLSGAQIKLNLQSHHSHHTKCHKGKQTLTHTHILYYKLLSCCSCETVSKITAVWSSV